MCKVERVTIPPAIGKPEMMQGIRTAEGAAKWGEKNGYSLVYFLQKKERVYADKTTRTPAASPTLSSP
jgi:hypothetical protein